MMFRATIASFLIVLSSAADTTPAPVVVPGSSPVAAPVVTSPVVGGTPTVMPFFSFTFTNAPVAAGPTAPSPVAASAPTAGSTTSVAPAAATSSVAPAVPTAGSTTSVAPAAATSSVAPAVPSTMPPVAPGIPTIGPLPPGTTLPPILSTFPDLGICSVCGDGYVVDNPAGMVSVGGYNFTCQEAQLAGEIGAFPVTFCSDALTEGIILPACGCILSTSAPVMPPMTPTAAPVVDASGAFSMTTSIIVSLTATMAAAMTL